jgi:hypothetical protein
MVHQGSCIVDLSTRWSLLRGCAYVLRNRTRAGAFPATKFQLAEHAFPDRYRSKPFECVRAAFRLNSTMHVR